MKIILFIAHIIFSINFFTYCLANYQEERFENGENIGKITVSEVDIYFRYAPVENINNVISARLQGASAQIDIESKNASVVTLDFLLKNLPKNAAPTVNKGTIAPIAGSKNALYSLDVQPKETFTVEISLFSASDSYSFATVGDLQYNQIVSEKILNNANGKSLDFFLVIGDFVSQPTQEEYEWALTLSDRFNMPVYCAYGNHEDFNDGYLFYEKYFGRPNYFFIHQNDLYLILDSAGQSLGKSVFEYAKYILENKVGQNKFIFTHVPVFDDSGMRNNGFNSRFEAARFQNMLIENEVDYIFSGHTHSYDEIQIGGVTNITAGTGGGIAENFDSVKYMYLIINRNAAGVTIEKVHID
ncbi:MAG: metallophosphoesterase [Spirochaetia bacterium]|nr:metallophosphoesterase [Spirochaetia bacterium]